MSRGRSRRRAWPIRVPEDWRVVRRSGTFLYDSLVPFLLILLGLTTVGLVLLTLGVMIGLVPYR